MNETRRRRFTVTALLLAWVLAPAAEARGILDSVPRNVQFANLSTENGLSSEFVHDLVQDSRGYIWFATQAGLNRFDGHEIVVYEHRSEEPGSISHSFVWSLHVDPDGVLWIGTDRGVNTYDPETDRFDRSPFGGSLSSLRVRKITQDRDGRFWVGSVASGLVSIGAQAGDLTGYRHDPEEPSSLAHDHVIAIHEDRAGVLWVGTDGGGLARFDAATESFVAYRHRPDDPNSLGSDQIRSIFEDTQGRLWVGTAEGGLNRMNRETGQFTRHVFDPEDPHSIGAGQVPSVFEDGGGTLWVGTEDGLSEWRPSVGGFVNYRRDPTDRKSLINNRVNAMIQDESGVLWLATNGGVSAWNYVSDTFQHYGSAEGFLDSDVVTAIAEQDDGTLWIGTYGGGLSRVDLERGTTRHFRHDPEDASSLSDDRVMTVHVDADDTLWAGTRSAGLCRLVAEGRFACYRSDPDDERSLSGDAVTQIFSDRSGTLWVGVFGGGLNRMRRVDGEPAFERFRHDPEDPSSLSGDRVLSIHQDAAGALWVGTESAGLNRLDPRSGRVQRFDIDESDDTGEHAVGGTPWEIHETRDGTMWIGTLGQGLLEWSAEHRAAGVSRFEQFGPSEGLAPDIYGILEGAAGELWLSSSRGLYRFDPRHRSVRRFDRSNGLRNNEFNHGARLATRPGRLIFGGTKGLVAFDPEDLPHNARPPSIDLVARSRTAFLGRAASSEGRGIELGYRDPFVSFEFVALDFISPDKNAYRFRLDGYDGDWTDAQAYRRAIYSNLPAGDYRFRVQAANSDGVWNREGASMRVIVTPPPWRTWWAYVVYAAAAAGLIAWLGLRQQRRRRQEAAQRVRLELLVNERTQELAERNEDLLELNRKLEQASVTDQLTGLRNRRFVDQFIEGELSALQRCNYEAQLAKTDPDARSEAQLLFLVMIDLDGFKRVNDSFGHHAGDQALLQVKDRLIACCRSSDVIVRWGGDEFLIFGHGSCFEGAKVFAEKIRRTLAEPRYDVGRGRDAELSASIGLAAIPFVDANMDLAGWEQIVAIADQGAYLAKRNGRNAWVSIRGTARLEKNDLQRAKDNLPSMVELGKLDIDTSVPGGVSLLTELTERRAVV